MAKVRTGSEWAGCIQHAFITKLSVDWNITKGILGATFPFTC